jgi:hypothetical protein
MTGVDLAETILSMIVFAFVFLMFLRCQHSRDTKRRAKEVRDQTLYRFRSRDC